MQLSVNTSVPLMADPAHGHNRWHPDIFPIAHVRPYEEVELQMRDALDGQIDERSEASDVRGIDPLRVHPLTGPLYVEGAEPGDLIELEILSIDPARFGYTIVRPAVGPLGDLIEEPLLVHWQIKGALARSDELPGVTIRGAPSIGVVGVAPSRERLRLMQRREEDLLNVGGLVMPPDPRGAVPDGGEIATAGLRTTAPRETGGNLDIKQLAVGSRLLLRVDVRGALLSLGDAHFAQGDGEICGQAIEVRAAVRIRVRLRKSTSLSWHPHNPVLEYTDRPTTPARTHLVTTGVSVDESAVNHDRDLGVASRAALLEMVDYLRAVRGLDVGQACALCSVAVDLRVSELANAPNVLVSASLPLDVFDDSDEPAVAISEPPAPDSRD